MYLNRDMNIFSYPDLERILIESKIIVQHLGIIPKASEEPSIVCVLPVIRHMCILLED